MSNRKLLVISDAPGSATGLGGQAQLLVEAGLAAGYEVVALGFHAGSQRPYPPAQGHTPGGTKLWILPYLPTAGELLYIVMQEQPDLIVGLADFWALACLQLLPESYWSRMLLWLTADCDLYDPQCEPFLSRVGAVVALSEYGDRVWSPLRKAGGRLERIPHAVKPSLLEPVPQEAIDGHRKRLGLEGHFVALHVGRNQMRKMTPHLIDGWAQFVRGLSEDERAKVTLYLHTEERPAPTAPQTDPLMAAYASLQLGWDLPALIKKHYADVAGTIRFSERGASDVGLREIYALCDVHVLVSAGEGFGVPLIEAQACGRANIAADNTTTPELVGGMDASHTTYLTGLVDVLAHPPGCLKSEPFGWRVECPAWTMQPDILEKRPIVSTKALHAGFGQAHTAFRYRTLNAPEIVQYRRNWTLARFGWNDVRDRWRDLISDVAHRRNIEIISARVAGKAAS